MSEHKKIHNEQWKLDAESAEYRLSLVMDIADTRLRELAEAERDGRINISQYPNCGMCKWVTVDMFAKQEPCKSCKSRVLAEKGEDDGK